MELKFNEWEVVDELGKGGNGIVYKVTKDAETFFALKVLKLKKYKNYLRFKDEILAIEKYKHIDGVIKIIDYYLPGHADDSKPYYVMPIGQPFQQFLWGKAHITLFDQFTKICQTLIELHAENCTHRDIKPNNILVIDGKPYLSDFGLVSYPSKNNITDHRESVGPKWTIAPEMKRDSTNAQFKKADIYSLAKTLWILMTRDNLGFEGQYDSEGTMSLRKNNSLRNKSLFDDSSFSSILLLEKLLTASTDSNPKNRPSATKFLQNLNAWLNTSNKFQHVNTIEWEETLHNIFPSGIPEYCEWSSFQSMHEILKAFIHFENTVHCFLPAFGGIDIRSLRKIKNRNEILINDYIIINPKKIVLTSLGTANWSYFRIILADEEPLHGNINFDRKYEEFHIDKLDNYRSNKNKRGIRVNRYLSGSMIIVSKSSYFNSLRGELDGYFCLHEKLTETAYLQKWKFVKQIIDKQEYSNAS